MMRKHGTRAAYYILGEGVLREPDYLAAPTGCPMAATAIGSAAATAAAAASTATEEATAPAFRFGFRFGGPVKQSAAEDKETIPALIELGKLMNRDQTDQAASNSDIPSGY